MANQYTRKNRASEIAHVAAHRHASMATSLTAEASCAQEIVVPPLSAALNRLNGDVESALRQIDALALRLEPITTPAVSSAVSEMDVLGKDRAPILQVVDSINRNVSLIIGLINNIENRIVV